MIVVTGATGTNGAELVRHLSAAGTPVRAMVRNPAKADALRLPHVEIVRGDLADPGSLAAAFAGAERLFLLAPVAPNMLELERTTAAAAKAAGVRHIVKLSAIGADPKSPMTFARWHGEAENAVEATGLAWTFLRPNFFMQNLLGLAVAIKSQGVIYQPAEQSTASFVDAADTAAVAAAALTQPGHEGKTYTVTGPESLGYEGLAATLARVTGRPVKYQPVPRDAAKQAMMQSGMPEWLAENISQLMDGMRAGQMAGVTDAVKRVTGRPPRTFEQFAQANRSAFA